MSYIPYDFSEFADNYSNHTCRFFQDLGDGEFDPRDLNLAGRKEKPDTFPIRSPLIFCFGSQDWMKVQKSNPILSFYRQRDKNPGEVRCLGQDYSANE